ncbi:MAG: DNA polymerase III subunit beta [Patescibacteria group bacterium]
MKGECLRDRLKGGVALVEKMTGKNLSLPVLSAILIEAGKGKLLLKATNLDVGIEYAVPAKLEGEGLVALGGAMLSNFLSTVGGDETIKFEVVGGNLALATKRTSTLIKSVPAEDFPVIPRVEAEETVVISAEGLREGIRAVLYAASLSDVKPEIASIYLYADNGELVFVATDGFRLAEKRVQAAESTMQTALLIPQKNAGELLRAIENEQGDVTVLINKNQLSLKTENLYFTTRLVVGNFPNYRQIMPTQSKTKGTLEKRDLVQALKLSALFSDRLSQIALKIDPAEGVCEVESKNQDSGENTTLLEGVFEGELATMSFNAKYVLDGLQSIGEEKVAVSLNGPGKPLVIKPVRDTSLTYLVMPMNR